MIDPPAGPGALGASLTATPRGVLATWIEPRAEDAHSVRFATLRNDTWSDASTVVEAPDLMANWADFPRAAMGRDGSIYVHYLHRVSGGAYAYEVLLTRSRDGGRLFEPLGVIHRDGTPTEHGFVSMLPEANGVRLFWLDGRGTLADGGATAVYTARIVDAGEGAIGDAVSIDDRACDCCQTDAALGPDGPLVVYRDRDEREVRDIALARWSGDRFEVPTSVHRDGWEIAGCPVNGPAVDAMGRRVAVAWFTGADGGSVRIAFSDDGGESFARPIDVDPNQPPGRVDVALVDGGAAVSWLARAGASGEVRVRYVDPSGRLGAPTVVARTATARESGFPVLVRDGARLLVVYRDGGEQPRIHVAQLDSADLPREPDRSRTAPQPAAIAIGDDMPDARVRDDAGEVVALSALAEGAPLVIAFFARWCQPCREELRELGALRSRLDPGVRMVAVSLDEGSAERAAATARGWGFSGRVVRDSGAAAALGVPPIPALFLFDGEGTLRGAWRGESASADEVVRRARALGPTP